MLSYKECLAKADAADTASKNCGDGKFRSEYENLAVHWRMIAALALHQDS